MADLPLAEIDPTLSIKELEGYSWDKPQFLSNVILAALEVRSKPIEALTENDLRIGLIQQIGLKYIVPLSLEKLDKNPFREVQFFEGDLLHSILLVPHDFWDHHRTMEDHLKKILVVFDKNKDSQDEDWKTACLPAILEAQEVFLRRLPSKKWLRRYREV